MRWNLFQDEYEFPDALPLTENEIAKEVKKYVLEQFQSKDEGIEYIEEQLDKQDRGMSKILSEIFKGRVKIMDKGNKTYLWNGRMWDEDISRSFHHVVSTYTHAIVDIVMDEVLKKISDLNSIEITDKNQENAVKATKKKLEGKNKQFKMFRDRLDKGITRPTIEFLCSNLFDVEFAGKINNHPYYIAAANGMVNLKTGCLEGFDPNFHLTTACKNYFVPCSCPLGKCTMDKECDSKCDLSFMHNTWLQVMAYDKELYNHLRWSVGYVMVGDPKKKKYLMGMGPQFNAKTLFSGLMNDVFNIYTKVMTTSVVIQTNRGSENGHSAHLTHLNGSRLAILNETDQGDRLSAAQVKTLTGGGKEKKNVREAFGKQAFDMVLSFVPWVFSNFVPLVPLNDEALWERIWPVLFPVTFKNSPNPENYPFEQQMNDDLPNILAQAENKQKFFNWVIRCCFYYCQNQDKKYPEQITRKLKDMQNECNDLYKFTEENKNRYKFDANKSMELSYLKEDFDDYCNRRYSKARKEPLIETQYFNLMVTKMQLKISENKRGDKIVHGLYCTDKHFQTEENDNDDNAAIEANMQ